MRKTLIIALFISSGFTTIAQAASFDCAKASTAVEKLICADEKLSILDDQLTTAYKAATETATDKATLKTQQKNWLKKKRNICKDAECLTKAYQSRIDALAKNITPAHSAEPDGFMLDASKRIENQKLPLTFKLVFGDSYPICKPYVDMLNAAKYMEYPACERKILPEFKQFKAVEWTEITDKEEMEKIMEKNITMELAGSDNLNEQNKNVFINSAKTKINDGSMKVYKADMDLGSDGNIETVYKTTEPHPGAVKLNGCTIFSVFYVDDKRIDGTKNIHKQFREKGYDIIESGDSSLTYANGKIYQDDWTARVYKYDIVVSEVNTFRTEICGIKIQ
jgi:uncharacterized protein YecT (DUF1311 family)